jgi:serine protease Do
MKKIFCHAASVGILCLTFASHSMAQASVAPPPPPDENVQADKGQTEIVIKQKGDKDTKIVLEIRNGEYFINGKPLDKYDDHNIEVEKRDVDQDVKVLRSYGISPFRSYSYEDDQQDMERGQRDMQKRMQRSFRIKMNMAFLGVSSKKSEKGGATVLEITKGSPAEKAGLQKGDIITKVNDSAVSSPEDLFEIIHNYKPGDKVKIVYTRDGKPQTTSATLEKSQEMPKDFNYNYNFKMPPMRIMPDMNGFEDGMWGQKQPKLGIKAQDNEDGKGVNIIEVEDSSAAAKSGLKTGDVITQFDGTDVNSTNELVDQLQEARKKQTIKVTILRNGVSQDIDVKIPRKLKTAEL